MRRFVLVVLAGAAALAGLVAGAASAVPCGPDTCAPFSVAPAGSGVLLSRPQGLQGPLAVFSVAGGGRTASLPKGVLAAGGRVYAAASLDSPGGTRVTRYDARTGARRGSWVVPGAPAELGAVSADGRYAALVAGVSSPTVTVADLDRRMVLRRVRLTGRWRVDALSRDGVRLYLLQLGRSGDYRVRVAVAGRGLLPGAVTDPDEPGPMTGFPWASVGTSDGRWQLTLFVKSANDRTEAFIHALSLDGATARCIDLAQGDFMALGRYALVLAPDGRTLYAANPSLGVVSVVDVARRTVVSTIRFRSDAGDDEVSSAFGAVTRDGRTLYFSAGHVVHVFDTRTHAMRRLPLPGRITGVAVSGRSLLVVRPDGTTVRADARTGLPPAA